MQLKHIEIENLKTTALNVRKVGAKDSDDLVPSIRALGILQPLLVRKNCEGYEIIAGQRRYRALQQLAREDGAKIDPVPCIIMDEGDDAKAIEASLAENIARLPMDEIDQYKAFAALIKQGKSVEDIANDFGVTERLVKQRLAIANLIAPILNAYRKDEIDAGTVRALTLATKRQQKDWWALYNSDDEYAPHGRALKAWLFGGANINTENALFDIKAYGGTIIADLFGDQRYFDDAEKFWPLQNAAIADAKESYLANGWSEVSILEVGAYWCSWEHAKTPKSKGGKVFVQIASDGEVTFHEGYLTTKEAERRAKAEADETVTDKAERPELTKAMQNYLGLHRHSAVRTELLAHGNIALRLAVAQMIAGSELWDVHADPQRANTDAITDSLKANTAEDLFAQERLTARSLLGLEDQDGETIVPQKGDWQISRDLHAIFAGLLKLDDEEVMRILAFVAAETLSAGSAMVEALGHLLKVDMGNHWKPDETFFGLLKDKEAINTTLKEVGGKATADAHISSTAKVQKQIIRDHLDGTRKPAKPDWQPRYSEFPMHSYTKRCGIDAIDHWKGVKKHYAA